MIKSTILLDRLPSLSREEFIAHKAVHAALFMSVAVVSDTVRRDVRQHAMPVELPGLPPLEYDGITQLWFDSVDDLGRCFSDAEYMAKTRPDEASFLDLPKCDFIVSTEHVVLA